MPEENTFADFLRRIRAGDDQAAVELARQYEPLIRTEVRLRLSDPRLYRVFDSMDIWLSFPTCGPMLRACLTSLWAHL